MFSNNGVRHVYQIKDQSILSIQLLSIFIKKLGGVEHLIEHIKKQTYSVDGIFKKREITYYT